MSTGGCTDGTACTLGACGGGSTCESTGCADGSSCSAAGTGPDGSTCVTVKGTGGCIDGTACTNGLRLRWHRLRRRLDVRCGGSRRRLCLHIAWLH